MREELPDAYLSVSSEVCPEFREYLRASTTAVNAAVMPIVSRYVDALETRLRALGATAPFYVMQSNGGVMTSASAKARPVYMVESGPAAGVIAPAPSPAPTAHRNVMSFDMGGTTAKVGLIQDGQLRLSTEIEVGAQAVTPLGEGRGGGYPVRTPVIDLVEVGAGGGSEAWIDAGGALRVGPRSAGARPGPACYGRGGATPTITDANLVLGRLNPAFFLGGEMALDADAARRAIGERVAGPLALDPSPRPRHRGDRQRPHDRRHAPGLRAARLRPRDFVLVAFGGAGPLHANALARELGIPTVLVPPNPGIATAIGMLMTDLRHEFVTTRRLRIDTLSPAALEALFADFVGRGRGPADPWTACRRRIGACCAAWTCATTASRSSCRSRCRPARSPTADIARLRAEFDAAHERAYGYAAPEDPVELVNVRLAAIGVTPRPAAPRCPRAAVIPSARSRATREVWFAEAGGWRKTNVLDRSKLLSGNVVAGPAIIEEHDASTLVHPGWTATVDEHGNLVLRP